MAWKLIDIRVNPLTNKKHREFICDTDADFANLPKSKPGDTAVSVATGNVYVVNASGEWVEFGGGADDSIVGTWVFTGETLDVTLDGFYPANLVVECDGEGGHHMMTGYGLIFIDGSIVAPVSFLPDNYSDWYENEWYYENNKITFLEEPTDETFIAWLKANATKVA